MMLIKRSGISLILIMAFALLLSGCASVPESVKGSGEPLQNLAQILAAPQQYQGQQARFGGKVLQVENQQDSTRLEISTFPLDNAARPELGGISLGRIYAQVNGFLDPEDYQGHLITVLGNIAGTQQGTVGQKPYTYLLLNISGYQRWRVVDQFMFPPQYYDPWFWGPYWGYNSWNWRPPFAMKLQTVIKD